MKFKKRKEILFERMGDEILAFDMRKNMPYILNPMAAYIFTLVEKNIDSVKIADRLCLEYEVGLQAAISDVDKIIDDLVQKGVLIPSDLEHPQDLKR